MFKIMTVQEIEIQYFDGVLIFTVGNTENLITIQIRIVIIIEFFPG